MAKTMKSHCNCCVGSRNHTLLFEYEETSREDVGDGQYLTFHDMYQLLRCNGCDSISLRHLNTFQDQTSDHYYPAAVFRKKPSWISSGSLSLKFSCFGDCEVIGSIHDEIYVALKNGTYALATMGVRALAEQVMIDCVSDNGSFAKNITMCKSRGYLSEVQADYFNNMIEAGHAAMHRGWKPSQTELIQALDMVEHFMEFVYANELRAKGLGEAVPKRGKKNGDSA